MAVTRNYVLDRQFVLAFKQEFNYGYESQNGTEFYLPMLGGFLREEHLEIEDPGASGSRHTSKRTITEKMCSFELEFADHPRLGVWFAKWAGGGYIADSTNGHYQIKGIPPGQDLYSFTIKADSRIPDFYDDQGQTIQLNGCKITGYTRVAASRESDGRTIVRVSGEAKKFLCHTAATITVLDYANITAGAILTITLNGVDYTFTEGSGATEWDAVTSNNQTASNISSLINDTTNGLSGVVGSATTNVVTLTPQTGYEITEVSVNEPQARIACEVTTTDKVMGLLPLDYAETQVTNQPSNGDLDYMFEGGVTQIDTGGYDPANRHTSYGLTIENTLGTSRYAKRTRDKYIDEKRLADQRFTFAFDKDYGDAMARMHDWRQGTERRFRFQHVHPITRDTTGAALSKAFPYHQIDFDMPRFVLREFGDVVAFSGANEQQSRNLVGHALKDERTTLDSNIITSGESYTALAIGTAWSEGVSGDAEAMLFTPSQDSYLTMIALRLRLQSALTGETLQIGVYSDAGTEPDTLLAGGNSLNIKSRLLAQSVRSAYFFFPNAPFLDASNNYYFVIRTIGAGTGTVEVKHDSTGAADQHLVTTNGGQTWTATNPTHHWDFAVYGGDVPIIMDWYTDVNATDLFADPTA